MISLDIIEREINELENRHDTTYNTCQRLSWLYVVRDHLLSSAENDEVTGRLSGSEFLEACSNVSYKALLGVIDEHLETVRVLYPKTYSSLVDKIRELSK